MERVSIGGSKVVQGAGKAVKLLGKLLGGGGGDRSAQDMPSAPSTARSTSYSSMALPPAPSAALPGVQRGCEGYGSLWCPCRVVPCHAGLPVSRGLLYQHTRSHQPSTSTQHSHHCCHRCRPMQMTTL